MSLADSPFGNRLHTNYVPSDSEVLEIRALLVDPANALVRMDAQIKAMEIALGQLRERRASLKEPIDAHRALISPMRRIPQDVLLEIFFSCLPTEHNALIDPAQAPLILGRIGRHWREVAYSAPMLWSSIHIPSLHCINTPPDILSRFEGIVKAWIERSAPCPLSVSLFDKVFYGDRIEEHPLIIQLLPVLPRLRHLELTGDLRVFLPLLRLGSADLPLLKRFWIKSAGGRLDLSNAFQISTLEDVALRITTSVDPLSFALPWSQLTRLCVQCLSVWKDHGPQGGLDIRRTFDLLRMCSNLVQCEIHVTKNTDRGLTLDMPPIFLPHLDTLLFSNCDFRNWILVAPKLRFLRIGQAYSWHNESMPEAGFLSVDVDPNQLSSPDGLRDLLEYFPMISHLRLSSPSLDHLELFCPPDDLLDLCPELTHLTVISPHNGFSDAAALAFVKARMALPLPLQQFCVRFGRQMKVDVMPELQCFIADGLRVSLEYLAPRWKFDAQEGLNGD